MMYYVGGTDTIVSEEEAKEINDRQTAILDNLKPGDDISSLKDFVFLFPVTWFN